jgi:hypothetical protein
LARSGLVAKAAVHGYWNLLDFLGFSRPNLVAAMGYAGFSLNEFSRALCLLGVDRKKGRMLMTYAKGRIVHGASLPLFPIYSKKMLAFIALYGPASYGPASGFPSWPGLTRPSTRIPSSAIKQLIILHEFESTHKTR